MNLIDNVRADIKKDLDENIIQKGDFASFLSLSKRYRLDATTLWSTGLKWELTQVEIYNQITNERLFNFFINDSSFFHGWLIKHDIEYLVCAEDIFGGQTVVDLTNVKMAGYSPGEDGFIWTDFHLSPNGKILATIGCYWACDSEIKLFDFSDPMTLPLKEIKRIELLGNDEIILRWLDDETLKMKGVKREREPVYHEGGGMTMKTLSEIKMEREININLS